MRRTLAIGLLVAASLGCGTSRDPSDPGGRAVRDAGVTGVDGGIDRDGGSARDGSTPDPQMLCPPGATLTHYSLVPLATLPPASALELPDQPGFLETVQAGDGVTNGVRFDVCETAGGSELRAILYHGGGFGVPRQYVLDEAITAPVDDIVDLDEGVVQQIRLPPSAFEVSGLAQGLGGDPSSFRARMVYDSGLLVHGHAGFVAVAQARVGATIEYTAVFVIVGAIAPGNVFGDLGCPFGENPRDVTFELGSAAFEIGACTFLGGGETEGYRIHHLAVMDSSPMLDPADRVRFEFETEAEVEAVMNYRWNHHNACDSFHLALPHADYAASTAPLAGCGETVPNAPPRDFMDPPSSPVAYRIRYYGGAWMEGTMQSCTHYMYCDR